MADKTLQATPGNAPMPPPGKPLLKSFPTPELQDRILQVRIDSRKGKFEVPDKGSAFAGPNEKEFEDFKFATCIPDPASPGEWWLQFYVNERKNQDDYNYSIEHPWVDKEYPRITRTYVILRQTPEEITPDPDEVDPSNDELSLIDFKVTRAEDPVIDALFIAITKVYERVPAPTEYALDRADAVLPYNMRVAVPAFQVTQVDELAAQIPILVNEEDWTANETTNTFNRRTRQLTKRVIPNGSITLDKGQELTREQQLGEREQTWAIGRQIITPRATTIRSTVEDVGNNTTVKDELVVPRVFPATEIKVEIPDIIPAPFRTLYPIRTIGITSEGQVTEPVLQIGELERIHRAETDLIKREIVTGRDITQLPKTLHDFDLDGIPSHGSVFGGIYDTARTLSAAPEGQSVEEGFEVLKSSVQNLGNGLTLLETKKLAGFQGAHLLLTNPGQNFTCDPAVVFTAGDIGSDAAGDAVLSGTPSGGTLPGEDIGGVFPLAFSSLGDTNGAFYFIGARYNGGVWQNPATAGNVYLNAVSNQPFSQDQLARMIDREPSSTPIFMRPGGGHAFYYDFGIGRSLKANLVTIQTPNVLQGQTRTIRVEARNDGDPGWTTIVSSMVLPATPINTWVTAVITSTISWRYIQIFRTDTNATDQALNIGEVEFYGDLSIAPSAELNYLYDGDNQGVFFYLGRRGNNGVWRNPSTYGDIAITASGTINGDLDTIVDRQESSVYSDITGGREFRFDLGANRGLICNKMSFRQRNIIGSGTQDFLFMGSNNGTSWTYLATVVPSQTPNAWTTTSVTSATRYRHFRIISAQGYFTVGEVELYGELRLAPPGGDTGTFSVTTVNMTNGGLNYIVPPIVRFIGGGGNNAAGTAIIANGVVTGVTMINGGTGYTSNPLVRFFVNGGGKNAAATANIVGTAVTSYTVDNPGVEYPEAPLVEIIGDGIGATAVATVNAAGQVTAVTPLTNGSGYTIASVLFRSAGGPIGQAVVGYGVASITKTNSGTEYNLPPAVEVRGDGTGCQAHAVLGFPIVTVQVTNRGNNYTSTPTATASTAGQGGGITPAALTAVRGFAVASVAFSPDGTLFLNEPAVNVVGGGIYGQGAQFKAWVGRPVLALQLGLQGSNYSTDIALTLTDPGGTGTGATGAATLSYALDSITGGTGGTGYTTANVSIGAPTGINGIQAAAHAVISSGVITSLVIDEVGFGYLTAPPISVTGDGTGVGAATAVLETTGAIDSVSLGATGAGYSEPPTVNITATTGSGAVITSSLNTTFVATLVKVTMISGGFGYTTPPALSIVGAPSPTATLSTSGQIVAVTVAGGISGDGYIQNAAVIFTGGGGSGAAATATRSTSGSVKSFVVDDPGEGFTIPPDVLVSYGAAAGTAVLQSTGKIKTLTLIDPGPDYAVAPLVSFFGCGGTGATALYILASGYPILVDYITDPREGIVVQVTKKIVRPDAIRPPGYVDQYALDKYRSIQLISVVDLATLPTAETFSMTHILNLPDTLVSISSTYSKDAKEGAHISTAFGSTSVHASVKGKIFARIQQGYKGPAKAVVIRTFLPAPPTAGQTPSPLIITPSTGTVYLISRGFTKTTSLGVSGGFGYIDNTRNSLEDVDALDLHGLLTGGLLVNQISDVLTVNPASLIAESVARAASGGFLLNPSRAYIASNIVSASATLIADIRPSCPVSIPPNTTFLLSAVVEKWKLGIYVQTLTFVTVPCPAGVHFDMSSFPYGYVCDPCGGAIVSGGGGS